MIASSAASKGSRIFIHDITQAYTQSDEYLSRELCLQPKPTDAHLFSINEREGLKLAKQIYGTTDVGDYWNVTVDKHAKSDLGMQPLTGDLYIYLKIETDKREASRLMGMLVDDGLLCEDEDFSASHGSYMADV